MAEPLKAACLQPGVALQVVEEPEDLMALQPVGKLKYVAVHQEGLVKGNMAVPQQEDVPSGRIKAKNVHLKVEPELLVLS